MMYDTLSPYEKNYRHGYRIGLAIGAYEITENIIKDFFPEYYPEIKYQFRRLSEYEINNLFDELIENFPRPCFSIIKKHLLIP